MLANSLAHVVAEEAAKRLLPDMTLGTQSSKCGTHRGQCGQTFGACKWTSGLNAAKQAISTNLNPLLKEEEACTRSAVGRLVDELAHQGCLLIRRNKRLKCKACNVCRADRFLEQNTLCPRPCAADVVSRFRNKERQHIKRFHRQFGFEASLGFLQFPPV